jgi:uncharacterized protein YprB with RNaseH-like and TPR domain
MATRINWKEHRELFDMHDDDYIVQYLNAPPDAVRLARKRYTDPSNGYVGLNMVYFDLETTNLTAIMGRLLCCSFGDSWGRVTTFRVDETDRKSAIDDRELAIKIRDYIEDNADILCGWNSKLFDVPFLNARLLRHGERPLRKDLMHIDLMYFARGQFVKIGSSKLVNVQKFSPEVENSKSDVDWDTWALAGTGDKNALNYVVEHCEKDILVLRDVFGQLKSHITNIHR